MNYISMFQKGDSITLDPQYYIHPKTPDGQELPSVIEKDRLFQFGIKLKNLAKNIVSSLKDYNEFKENLPKINETPPSDNNIDFNRLVNLTINGEAIEGVPRNWYYTYLRTNSNK